MKGSVNVIFAVADQRQPDRYLFVGRTTQPVQYEIHLRHGDNRFIGRDLRRKVAQIHADGGQVELVVLAATIDPEQAKVVQQDYIDQFRSAGHDLLNMRVVSGK